MHRFCTGFGSRQRLGHSYGRGGSAASAAAAAAAAARADSWDSGAWDAAGFGKGGGRGGGGVNQMMSKVKDTNSPDRILAQAVEIAARGEVSEWVRGSE